MPGRRRPFLRGRRLERERATVAAMISLSCRDRHAAAPALCAECADLEAYTRLRLEKCPYGEEKPTCADCPIHCYLPKRRQQIKEVMAYAGPRMLLSHPVLAVRHMVDGWRKGPPPDPPRRRGSSP
ncbi:MAG: nitrous oxide-stimulated promoter family protein [Acidobacteriota bacterium]